MKNCNLRIIYVTHYTELYGANRSLLNLIDGLANFNITGILVVIPGRGRICEELDKRNVEYIIIPFVNETYYVNQEPALAKKLGKFIYNWYIVLRWSKHLRKTKNTIIHSNSSATLIGAYFSYWLHVPHVWHLREFGLADYNFKYNFGKKYFNSWLNKAHAVIAISNTIFEERVRSCRALNKVVVYNAVMLSPQFSDKNLQPVCQQPMIPKFSFGIIGLINKEKGQEEAIEAFKYFNKENPDCELIIAGNGADEYVATLQQKIAQSGLEKKIRFTGFLENTDDFYHNIHCLLMCSRHEAFGRVTIEAMSHAIPVIGYDNAGTSEIIVHGYNGLLYRNDAHQLSEMMTLIVRNGKLFHHMAQNAKQTVKEKFNLGKHTEMIHKIYESLR